MQPPEPFEGEPFVFGFDIPVYAAPVVEVNQKVTASGVTLTLERVFNSPGRPRAVVCYEPPDGEHHWTLRERARKESQAPRNPYEPAFRNQFYTPDYVVVRFLTDNALGRAWYEMRQGNTRLTRQCEYLMRRPDEVFLAQDASPEIAEAQEWLRGEDVPEPDVVHLGHAVNGFRRVPPFGEGGNKWVEERLPPLT